MIPIMEEMLRCQRATVGMLVVIFFLMVWDRVDKIIEVIRKEIEDRKTAPGGPEVGRNGK